jgi:hypothetical protein
MSRQSRRSSKPLERDQGNRQEQKRFLIYCEATRGLADAGPRVASALPARLWVPRRGSAFPRVDGMSAW